MFTTDLIVCTQYRRLLDKRTDRWKYL